MNNDYGQVRSKMLSGSTVSKHPNLIQSVCRRPALKILFLCFRDLLTPR
jgi:hypothetical protein